MGHHGGEYCPESAETRAPHCGEQQYACRVLGQKGQTEREYIGDHEEFGAEQRCFEVADPTPEVLAARREQSGQAHEAHGRIVGEAEVREPRFELAEHARRCQQPEAEGQPDAVGFAADEEVAPRHDYRGDRCG